MKLRLIALLVFSVECVRADGIFIYKNHNFQADKDAKVFRYDKVEPSGPVTWVEAGGKRMRFEKNQFHAWLELDAEVPDNITSPKDFAMLDSRLSKILIFRKRFPQTLGATGGVFQLFSTAKTKLSAGEFRHEKRWISSDEFNAILAAKESANSAAQMALEKAKADRLRIEELKVEAERQRALAESNAREKRRFARIQDIEKQIDQFETLNNELMTEINEEFLAMENLLISNQK